ncbi:MAG: hypothetical protein RJB55_2036, partial [Verrucomicrobiota bacterium]
MIACLRLSTKPIRCTLLAIAWMLLCSSTYGAKVYFNHAYPSVDGTAYTVSTSSITIGPRISGTSITFSSADPALTVWPANGNNEAGTLSYVDPSTGAVTNISGIISRQEKDGSTTRAFYFVTNTVATNNAYLLVLANSSAEGYYSGLAKPASIGTSSDPVGDDLNDYLNSQASLPLISVSNTNATVTEDSANPLYAVFQVNLSRAASGNVTFTPKLFSGTATVASGSTPAVGDDVYASSTIEQSADGSSWSTASGGVTIPTGSTSVRLRVRIVGDLSIESDETFNLWTQVLTTSANVPNNGGAFATGTILNDDVPDTTPPTIAVTSSVGSLKAGETATITFTLSESSADFVAGDVTVSGGTLSNFAGSGATYTATFTPTTNSTTNGVISVASTRFSDAAGNFNADGADANNTVTVTVNTVRPTIAVTSSVGSLKAGETATITFTLSETATDFALADVTATGGTLSSFAGSGTSYTATFTPTANSTTSGVISVASGTFSNAAGNFNADGADANNTVTLTVNTVRPTIAVTSSVGSL